MAVKLRIPTLLLRKDAIENRYLGGWAGIFKDYQYQYDVNAWFDDRLYCLELRSSANMRSYISQMQAKGLVMFIERDGQPVGWQDGCVVINNQPTLPCDWITLEKDLAWLRGTEPGDIIGRLQFRRTPMYRNAKAEYGDPDPVLMPDE
jgi:hypothetical protein